MNRSCSQLVFFGLAGHALAQCIWVWMVIFGPVYLQGRSCLVLGRCSVAGHALGGSCFAEYVLLIVVLRRNPPGCQENVGHEEGANVSGFLYSASPLASA